MDAVPFAMENPEKGITQRTASRLTWISNTTGDDDGVDLTLEAPPDAVLRFRTPVIDLDVRLDDLDDGDDAHLPGRRRRPARVHAAARRARLLARRWPSITSTESPPRGACHAYWMRATQEDGAQAWTSPVYLER